MERLERALQKARQQRETVASIQEAASALAPLLAPPGTPILSASEAAPPQPVSETPAPLVPLMLQTLETLPAAVEAPAPAVTQAAPPPAIEILPPPPVKVKPVAPMAALFQRIRRAQHKRTRELPVEVTLSDAALTGTSRRAEPPPQRAA